MIAVATLAFGIGANTAMFSVFNGILLRPLGYGDEGRLVAIHEVVPKFVQVAPRLPVNAMHFEEWQKDVTAFQQMALVGGLAMNLTGEGEPERLVGGRASASLFPMLHAQTQLGRTFTAEEDQTGRDNVVVSSDRLWRRRFAADPHIVGRKLLLDGRPYEVIGVLSADFHFPKLSQLYAMTIAAERPELWKPFAVRPAELTIMDHFSYVCIGRLRPGISIERARAQLDAAQARIASRVPEKIELFSALVPLRDQITGRSRAGLRLILWAVGIVLLIGAVNVANLLLTRTMSRKRELAIRAALGASGRQLIAQTVAESLVLAGIGGAAGLVLAYGALRVLLTRASVDLPRLDEVRLDLPVLAFTAGITVLAGLVFGILPAWRFRRTDPQDALRTAARGNTETASAGRTRAILVGVEVGLSTVCLVAGGLLLRSYIKLLEVDGGFRAQRVIAVNLSLPANRYRDQPQVERFTRSLLDSMRATPGVVSAGVSNRLPLGGEGGNDLLSVEGTNVPYLERPVADIRSVNTDYFATLGIPLRDGRIFEERDGTRLLAVVSEQTAGRLWPGENPVGRHFKIGDPSGPFWEVAGVVGDVSGVALDKAPKMTVYVPFWRYDNPGGLSLAVKSAGEPAGIVNSVRSAIRKLDAELPIPQFRTMEEVVDRSVAQRRFQMDLILLFGAAALALASLGIYGVASYSVALRTNEIGIRMALGARAGEVVWMVLRQGMAPVMAGLGCGLLASIAAGRLISGLLYGIGASDGATLAGVSIVLGAVAAFASVIPARRAARVDPMIALHYE